MSIQPVPSFDQPDRHLPQRPTGQTLSDWTCPACDLKIERSKECSKCGQTEPQASQPSWWSTMTLSTTLSTTADMPLPAAGPGKSWDPPYPSLSALSDEGDA